MLEVEYNKNENILYSKHLGPITKSEMIQAFNEIEGDIINPRPLYVIEDARKTDVELNVSDVQELVRNIASGMNRFSFVRHAVIVSKPRYTALVMIAGKEIAHMNYKMAVFSTPNAAKKWLLEEI